MLKTFLKKIIYRLELFSLDKYELKLIKYGRSLDKQESEKIVFFQCPLDHFFLHLFSEVIKKEKKWGIKFVGKIEIPIRLNIFDIILILPFVLKKIQQLILIYKWKKLYSSIGISEFLSIKSFSLDSFF